MSLFYLVCSFFLTSFFIYIGYWFPQKTNMCVTLPIPFSESTVSNIPAFDSDRPFKLLHIHERRLIGASLVFTGLLHFSFSMVNENRSLGFFLSMWSICTILLTTTDFLYYVLPNTIVGIFFCLFLIYHLIINPLLFSSYVLSGLFLFALLSTLFYLSPQSLGGGDVKLAGLIGFVFGYHKSLLAIFIASTLALLYSSFYFIVSKKKPTRTFLLPFGPFLFAGTWVVIIHLVFFP